MSKSPSSFITRIAHAGEITSYAKAALERSREAQQYNTAMLNYASIIRTIIETGTLGDKVDAEISLQDLDVNKAADKDMPTYILQANDAVVNFNAALRIYDKLTADPAWYREYADGFLPKNKRDDLPVDEFRQALASQNSREGNRDTSINNLSGEEALYDARRALLASINSEYQKIQSLVLAGDEPPPGSARTGRGKAIAGSGRASKKRSR